MTPPRADTRRLTNRLHRMVSTVVSWLEGAGSVRAASVIFVGFSVLYLATASYSSLQSVDTIAAALPAWKVAEHGTLRVDEFRTASPWFIETSEGYFSNRFPGVIFIAVPAYAVAGLLGLSDGDSPTLIPAGVTAALVTAAAMALLYLVFRAIVPAGIALAGVLAAGLGTGTWSVSAHALWTHGPAQLYLVAGMLALAYERFAPVGLAHGLAVFTRPQLAVVALVTGTWTTLRRQSVRPALLVGGLSGIGLALLIAYNAAVFGEPSITGRYGTQVVDNFTSMDVRFYLTNWALTIFSPSRGILPNSPFLLFAIPGLLVAWRNAPSWVRVSAVSGLVYMTLQLRINIWTGGDGFFGYRLPIEMLTLLAPVLLLACWRWMEDHPARQAAFGIAVAWSVALQAFGATVYLPLLTKS